MPDDLNPADRQAAVAHGATESAALERRARDRDYHRARAVFERAAADRTADPAARNAHLQLAELYDAAVRGAARTPAD